MNLCPNCGADLPGKAKVCPECGSDENTGWSDDARAGGLDLPDEEFNYEEFVEKEFGKKKKFVPRGIHWFWWIVGILLAAIFLMFLFRR